jgi:hypothetical protein
MSNLYPILSASPLWSSVGENFSWIKVNNDIPREMYAQAVYTVNHGNNYDSVNNHTVGTTNGQVLTANSIRKALFCRNLTPTLDSSGILYVKFGLSASDTSWNIILKPATDGFGESFFDEQVYHGDVSVYCANSSRKYMLWEGF